MMTIGLRVAAWCRNCANGPMLWGFPRLLFQLRVASGVMLIFVPLGHRHGHRVRSYSKSKP